MRTVYIDGTFCCHVTEGSGRTPINSTFFDGKCDAFVEGYRFVPAGESWVREDGVCFRGEMAAPHRDHAALDAAQRAYEQEKIADYELLINELYEEAVT